LVQLGIAHEVGAAEAEIWFDPFKTDLPFLILNA
jgi:hypothetical protein